MDNRVKFNKELVKKLQHIRQSIAAHTESEETIDFELLEVIVEIQGGLDYDDSRWLISIVKKCLDGDY